MTSVTTLWKGSLCLFRCHQQGTVVVDFGKGNFQFIQSRPLLGQNASSSPRRFGSGLFREPKTKAPLRLGASSRLPISEVVPLFGF